MKRLVFGLLVVGALSLAFSLAVAAGDAEKGKALFNNPAFAGGTAGKSCNTCHPGGQGLEAAAEIENLKATINRCIVGALKGEAIDPDSDQMRDMVTYVDSLKVKK